jgi:hypothetical protein
MLLRPKAFLKGEEQIPRSGSNPRIPKYEYWIMAHTFSFQISPDISILVNRNLRLVSASAPHFQYCLGSTLILYRLQGPQDVEIWSPPAKCIGHVFSICRWPGKRYTTAACPTCQCSADSHGSLTTCVPDHIPSDTCQLCDHSHVYFIMETLHSTQFKQWIPVCSYVKCLIQSWPSSTTLTYDTHSKHITILYLYESMGMDVHTDRKLDVFSMR